MKKANDTIKYAALYSSGDALKLFSPCAEIQLTLRANFMTSLLSYVLWRQRCTLQGSKCQSLSQMSQRGSGVLGPQVGTDAWKKDRWKDPN